jgi:hypothetical protein
VDEGNPAAAGGEDGQAAPADGAGLPPVTVWGQVRLPAMGAEAL